MFMSCLCVYKTRAYPASTDAIEQNRIISPQNMRGARYTCGAICDAQSPEKLAKESLSVDTMKLKCKHSTLTLFQDCLQGKQMCSG